MRIDNQGPRELDQTGKAADRSGGVSLTRPKTAEVSTHAASPELNSLRDAVRLLPAVRPGVVAEIAHRLGLGELSNQETLSRTADALTTAAAGSVPLAPNSELAPSSPLPSDLLAALGQLPLVREDRVAQATTKLQAGTLSTSQAIDDTAAALSN